jgi:excisionase family DNA binding protein
MPYKKQSAPERLLTPRDVMDYLQVQRSNAYSLLQSGAIPSIKVGRLRRVRQRDLEDYVDRLREAQRH